MQPARRIAAPPDETSDLELVDRILAGEKALFAVLVRRHNQRLYRAVRSILRADPEAEDVVQQAYVTAFHKLAQFRGEASFATWLTRIAVNEAFGRLRTTARRGELSLVGDGPDDEATMAKDDRTPESEVAARELGRVLERHIDALPPHYRSVFVLRDVEELDTAETAASLELSEEAVRVRLHRARRLLQESLTETLGAGAGQAYRFDGERCDRIVRGVLSRLGL